MTVLESSTTVDLSNRHVVVTGGGSGVGAATAHAFAAAGARVTILGRTKDSLVAQNMPYQVCDVTDEQAVMAAVQLARAEQGAISIVVANAGAAASKPFAKMHSSDLTAMLDVNLGGVFNIWHAALPDMKSLGWGRMIAIASTAGLKGFPLVSGYCAAKHAVVGLTRSLAMELAQTNITVNSICPGFTDTPLLDRAIATIVDKTGMTHADASSSLQAANPQKRFIQTDEIAGTAVWLCTDSARSINGHALSLSGGEI